MSDRHLARLLMTDFAARTGLVGDATPRRYLWTDAFAVCNFLGLHRETGEGRYLDLALGLVDQVHHVLGRHRPDDVRQGWISGLPPSEGERHPTWGGLRIGKELPERRADEPFDSRLEWERDGQYLHYLTQWMHALGRVSQETRQPIFHQWAIELAATAHARFGHASALTGQHRMVWKMSVDLERVLVPSMGQHDPLDCWLAYLELEAGRENPPTLDREIAEAATLCADGHWETEDALGIGALLLALHRLARLRPWMERRGSERGDLADRLLAATRLSLDAWTHGAELAEPADSRLAFRELGLAIGLHAIGLHTVDLDPSLRRYLSLADRIDEFWSDPGHRRCRSWIAHRDINEVMLATSLAPDGYLGAGDPADPANG